MGQLKWESRIFYCNTNCKQRVVENILVKKGCSLVQLVSTSIFFTILRGTMVKMTYNHKDHFKMVCNCICNYDLWLMSIWMKLKNEKWTYIIYFWWNLKIDENVIIFATWGVVHKPLNTTWHFIQVQLWL